MATPGPRYKGWYYDRENDRLDVYWGTTRAFTVNDCGVAVTGDLCVGGDLGVCGNLGVCGTTIRFANLPTAACCLSSGDLYTSCTCCVKTLHVA